VAQIDRSNYIETSVSNDKSNNLGSSESRAVSTHTNYENTEKHSNFLELSQDSKLLKAVEDSIEKLILKRIETAKYGNQSQETRAVDQGIVAAIAVEAARIYKTTRMEFLYHFQISQVNI